MTTTGDYQVRAREAALTLSFDGALPYSFSSTARWPATDNYDDVVREAVEQVLRARYGDLECVAVVLRAVTFDAVGSSPDNFVAPRERRLKRRCWSDGGGRYSCDS